MYKRGQGMESILEEAIRKKKKLRLVSADKTHVRKKAAAEDGLSDIKKAEARNDAAPLEKGSGNNAAGEEVSALFGEGGIDEKRIVRYLLSTVHEVIEVSRRPVPVLDKSGQPTGATEYQSATVLKACELMAKLMGAVREDEGKGVSVQIVSYRDVGEEKQLSADEARN